MSKKIFYTPGPSQLFFSVEQHLKTALFEDIPSISHRSKQFCNVFQETTESLAELLNLPNGYHLLFTGSATEIWERIAQNLIGNKSYHFVNGSFGEKFSEIASDNGASVSVNNPGFGLDFEVSNIDTEADLISITLNETSAGFQFSNEKLTQINRESNNALIALDVVSIVPAVPIDFSLVDTAYFSVQKCFGLPAGLGVWIVNDRALERAKKIATTTKYTGSYHSLKSLIASAYKYQTPETPNVLSIYLLGKVAQDMIQKGKEMMHRDTSYKAALLYQAFDENPFLTPFIVNKNNRSKTVCVADVQSGSQGIIDQFKKTGIVLGSGYGNHKDSQIRIANFPTHSKEQIELLSDRLKSFEPN